MKTLPKEGRKQRMLELRRQRETGNASGKTDR